MMRNRCKSAKKRNDKGLNVVNLELDDIPTVQTMTFPAGKYEALMKPLECYRKITFGLRELFMEDGEAEEELLPSPPDSVIETLKSEFRNNDKTKRPYRPNSSHQYLTTTELKDASLQDTNLRYGRPTRTTLLRDRQRRRSVTAVGHERGINTNLNSKQCSSTLPLYGSVTNLLNSMIPPGQSLHSFLSGARYNRANWISSMGNIQMTFDQSVNEISTVNALRRPTSVEFNIKVPPPDSASHREEGFSVNLPSLIATSPSTDQHPEQMSDSRTVKKAWEENKRMSPLLPDKGSSRFDTISQANANVPCRATDRSYDSARSRPNNSIRIQSAQPAKKHLSKDMPPVMIHGMPIHGSLFRDPIGQSNARDLPDVVRSSSANAVGGGGGGRETTMPLLDHLKVTGVKFTGTFENLVRLEMTKQQLNGPRPGRSIENEGGTTMLLPPTAVPLKSALKGGGARPTETMTLDRTGVSVAKDSDAYAASNLATDGISTTPDRSPRSQTTGLEDRQEDEVGNPSPDAEEEEDRIKIEDDQVESKDKEELGGCDDDEENNVLFFITEEGDDSAMTANNGGRRDGDGALLEESSGADGGESSIDEETKTMALTLDDPCALENDDDLQRQPDEVDKAAFHGRRNSPDDDAMDR